MTVPIARKPIVLGFVGTGATSAKNASALLTDLIKSAGGKAKIILPATKEHWTEGIEAVADFALEAEHPLVLVTDDTTTEVKALKGYLSQATEKIKVTKPVNKVVQLVGGETNSKLIVLWDDEDDNCYTALEAAEQNEVEALDLCAGLHKLELTGDQGETEASDGEPDAPAEDAEPEADDLDDMDEAELQDAAEALGLNVEEYPEWEDVRAAIREAREAGETEDGGVPTADEVMDWDFPTLKEYAQANDIEVPPRSKTFGYRQAITAWLETQGGEGDLELPDDDGEALEVEVGEFDFTGVTEPITTAIDELRQDIQTLGNTIAEGLASMTALVEKASTNGATAPVKTTAAPRKAATTTKTTQRPAKAAQKAAPAPAKRAVNRPSPKAPAAPKPKGRPLDPFMHLLGKKLTKAQARDIMIANASKGRGRPTEDERHLVGAARELVPNV